MCVSTNACDSFNKSNLKQLEVLFCITSLSKIQIFFGLNCKPSLLFWVHILHICWLKTLASSVIFFKFIDLCLLIPNYGKRYTEALPHQMKTLTWHWQWVTQNQVVLAQIVFIVVCMYGLAYLNPLSLGKNFCRSEEVSASVHLSSSLCSMRSFRFANVGEPINCSN